MLAKKSLGQNFLRSESALNSIISAGKVTKGDFVLEIGPGMGSLTEKILEAGANVLAIEKDAELISFLNTKFKDEIQSSQLTIENRDILEFDERQIKTRIKTKKYKLVANIPYYITGAIIRKFLSSQNQPELAVLLVQKEVADRIVANPGKIGTDKHPKIKESLLSISVKAYARPKFIKTVPAGSFAPAPKVDSAIILLENINNKTLDNHMKGKKFFDILHAGFAHKRKVLRKNLELFTSINGIEKSKITQALKEIEKPESVRAEELSISDWVCLTNLLN